MIPNTVKLTRREIEIMELYADGYTREEIAGELFVSPHTVNNHVDNIRNKYNCSKMIQAVAVYMFDKGRLNGKE